MKGHVEIQQKTLSRRRFTDRAAVGLPKQRSRPTNNLFFCFFIRQYFYNTFLTILKYHPKSSGAGLTKWALV
jgi:hypothetical protein